MKRSKFLSLNMSDAIKGLFLAAITALVSGVYQLISTGTLFTWENIKSMLLTVLATILSYIIKNFLTNSQGEVLKTENSELVKFVKRGNPISKIILIGLLLSGIGINSYAQGGWKITKEDFKVPESQALKMNQPFYSVDPATDSVFVKRRMFIRTAANAAFMNLTHNSESKTWDTEFLSLIGYGVTLQWYTLENNIVIPTWGVTPMIMTNTGAFEDVAASRLYFGAVGSYRGLLTLGLNVDLKTGKVGVMPGVQLTF